MPTVPALAVFVASTRGQRRSSFPGFCYAAAPGDHFSQSTCFPGQGFDISALEEFPTAV
jgi:hypothetical protein